MNAIVPAEQTQAEKVHVYKPSRMLDPQRFEYLWKLTEVIAQSELVPQSIRAKKNGATWADFPPEKVKANVFLVVEQADRWGISPFALIQASSIVHGKLCFEGKVITGVLQEIAGINLHFEWNGKTDDNMGCRITGYREGDSQPCVWPPRESGKEWVTVAEWKTTGEGSPWQPKNYARQMMYRGSREWTRLYQPSILLGVFSDDEIEEIGFEAAAQGARTIRSAAERRSETTPAETGAGFDKDSVTRALPNKQQVPMEKLAEKEGEKLPVETGETNAKVKNTEADPPKNTAARSAADVDRNGPGASDSTATAGQPSEASTSDGGPGAGGAVESAGGDAPPAGGSFDFKGYSDVLNRATQHKSLKSFSDDYRTKHAWTTEEAAKDTLAKIYIAHQKRLKGELDARMLDAELRELGAI